MTGRIYSVGYEGMTVDAMIERLVGSKVTTLVDVRLNPSSRRPGWSRKALTASLDEAGITYVHEKLLGNPPENRDSFRRGDGEEGREAMRERLSNGSAPALDRLIEMASGDRVAVLCVERERERCHRQVVTDMVQEKDPTIEVLHIL
jgi:uncharacterized protein (DUF488 family)